MTMSYDERGMLDHSDMQDVSHTGGRQQLFFFRHADRISLLGLFLGTGIRNFTFLP